MNTFSNIKEIIFCLNKERQLLYEMFTNRKSLSYKYDNALDIVDNEEQRISYLLEHSVIRRNGNFLEIDDQYIQFFEQILEVNEDINISYINENIESIKDNIIYYSNERAEHRKYNYLKIIKRTLSKISSTTLRNVVDLRRNIDSTFKNEPNYKNKKAKLENLDKKRMDIQILLNRTELLLDEQQSDFFRTAFDEDLSRIIVELKHSIFDCNHNLIEIERQIIDYLNQIKYQSGIIEKIRQLKYLKDQFIIEASTNISQLLEENNSLVFEPNPMYPTKLSIDYLNSDAEAFESILKIASKYRSAYDSRLNMADNISQEYLEASIDEEILIDLDDLIRDFLLSKNNLFDYIVDYEFSKEVCFDERLTIFCQLASQYENDLSFSSEYKIMNDIEFNIIYPKN